MIKLRFNQSLRTRLMAFSGILFLVITVLMVGSILFFVTTTERDTWHERQMEAAQNAAGTVADYLRQNESVLDWIDKYEFDEIAQKPEVLQTILKDHPAFMEIIYIDTLGTPLWSTARGQSVLANQFTILQSEWFRMANSGQKVYTRVQTSPENKSYTIYAVPSLRGGVWAAQIQMDTLWETVRQIRFGKTGSIYVINDSGQVIAHNNPQVVLSNQNISNTPLFVNIFRSPDREWIGNSVNFEGTSVINASAPVGLTQWVVISELPISEAYATSRRASVIIPLGILLLMTLAMGFFRGMLIRFIIHPLTLLQDGAYQIGKGNLSHRIESTSQDEFGKVMSVFNSMAAELEEQHTNLQKHADILERRVQERTTDLSRMNESLANEIKERKAAEEQVRTSLHEKEVLLKEIHHRVKNNLQIISSLLSLQSKRAMETGALQILQDSQSRVRSMALIHEKLYQSQGLAKIDFGEYVQSLANDLLRSYQRGSGNYQLKVQVESVFLNLDQAVPCGLILNELMTNAFKYAFPDGRRGTVRVELYTEPEQIINLRVADDGVGLPDNLNIRATKSLGWQLINNLIMQLEGTLVKEEAVGTSFRISFGTYVEE